MPRLWCWWPGKAFSPRFTVLFLLLGWVAADSLIAATLLQKRISHRVQADGSVLEATRLQVHLESSADVDEWSTYSIYLDDHRNLVEIETYAVTPAGERIVVKKKHHDVNESARGGVLADSASYRLVEFPKLPAGSVLHISHTVREAPYFPASGISLGSDDDIASLEVEIEGPSGLRFRVDGQADGWGPDSFRIEQQPGRVRVVGEGLPKVDPPDLAPGDARRGPVLRYSWDGQGTWSGVAGWYERLLDSLGTSPEVAAQARRLTEGRETPREKLDALLAYTSEKVRYVAVEMGIGGFVPTAPPETLARGWGDCKDKVKLLIDMLETVGIEAHPALILSGRNRRIDREFPSPYQFNHAIVAVPVTGQELAVGDNDPVADGYLFLDPTDSKGSSRWLHAAVQDQDVLVVAGERSALVRTPRLFDRDLRELRVDLDLSPDGGAAGQATLVLGGRYGDSFRHLLAEVSSDRVEEVVRSMLAGLLPGVDLTSIGWGDETDAGPPRTTLMAQVGLPGLVQGSGDRRSFQLPGIAGTPDLDVLEERTLPVVVAPGTVRESWSLRLPQGLCPDEPRSWQASNPLGSFEQVVDGEASDTGGVLTVERLLDLRQRWVEPDEIGALRELALEETRARKRRLRFGACGS